MPQDLPSGLYDAFIRAYLIAKLLQLEPFISALDDAHCSFKQSIPFTHPNMLHFKIEQFWDRIESLLSTYVPEKYSSLTSEFYSTKINFRSFREQFIKL